MPSATRGTGPWRRLAALAAASDDVVLYEADVDLNAVVQTEVGSFDVLTLAGEPIIVPLDQALALEREYRGRIPGLRRFTA